MYVSKKPRLSGLYFRRRFFAFLVVLASTLFRILSHPVLWWLPILVAHARKQKPWWEAG